MNINVSRILGGAVTSFLSVVQSRPPSIGGLAAEWSASTMYEALLGSVGGDVGSRSVAGGAFRFTQVIGNCPMSSALAVSDKFLVSESLAERMRFINMARATFAYFDGGEAGAGARPALVRGDHAEDRRRLLLKGTPTSTSFLTTSRAFL